MKIWGIQFAPIWIPLERRLQTFAVLYCNATIFISIVCLFVGMLLLFSQFYYIPLLYISWLIYDSKAQVRGYRRSDGYRRWKLWDHYRNYYPVRMVKTTDLSPTKNYLMVYHPHGILCNGLYSCCATESTHFKEEFPGLIPRILIGKAFFLMPFLREQFLMTGACVATKEAIDWLFTNEGKGNALILVPGGAAESLESRSGLTTLLLKSRKGFVKMALKHGASLVPIFAFGENDIFTQVEFPEDSYIRMFQKKMVEVFGFTIPLYYGRGILQYRFGFLPYRKPITVVFGKPIPLEADPEPSNEKINVTHQLYVESLIELVEQHKAKYGPNMNLKIM